MTNVRIGVMYDRAWDPAGLVGFARQAEEIGLDDLWVVEDLGWNGGVSAAAIALGATTRLRVGIGIAPAPLRSPALLAMELATLERAFPGRLVAGIGHGASNWMAQVGLAPKSALAMLEETFTAVRALLRGEKVELDGREVHIDGVRLVHPPEVAPPLVAGVVQPRSLELAGRVADGTLLAEGHGPDDVRTAWELARKGGAGDGFGVVAYAAGAIDDDPDRAAAALREFLAGHAAWLGRTPDELFTVSGTAAQAATRIEELVDAGAQTVILRVFGPEPLGQMAALLAARAAEPAEG
ncbi:LLM class flavin-dependent oxidoreductase [Streptomyces sp. NPDC021020]|uniref:LLM class flavin-dependent oxidoreductase n=1 Tax=Streptomyces sp. NPDC021020 TaxID=3365109 RepID=UPI00378A9A6D